MKFEDGKYEVVFDKQGLPQEVLRNGEPWRDVIGDKFMYLVFSELLTLRKMMENVAILPEKEWLELEYWLDRCYDKGHLENCPDLIKPLEALNKARGY